MMILFQRAHIAFFLIMRKEKEKNKKDKVDQIGDYSSQVRLGMRNMINHNHNHPKSPQFSSLSNFSNPKYFRNRRKLSLLHFNAYGGRRK